MNFIRSITSPNAPMAIGPYTPCVQLGDFVYISGQLPVNASTKTMDSTIELQTKQSIENIQSLLAKIDLELRHVVKTTVYMTDLAEFDKMNEVYAQFFKAPFPARSCVEVKALPKGAKIEIECMAIDTLKYERQMSQGCQGGCHGDCGGDCEDGGCGSKGCENCG